MTMCVPGTYFDPPVKEIIIFQPEDFPLHRWDNSAPPAQAPPAPRRRSLGAMHKLPFRQNKRENTQDLRRMRMSTGTTSCTSEDFDGMPKLPPRKPMRSSPTVVPESNSNPSDAMPKRPPRRLSPMAAGPAKDSPPKRPAPKCLASCPVGPSRRPPSRSKGYNHNLDLQDIPLKRIVFEGKKLKEAIAAQPLQEVVMERCAGGNNAVNVVFAIRRPGCGQCREHGMQLAEMCAANPNVNLTGVIKHTAGIQQSIFEFYSEYFNFPLYMDEGLNLYNTIGNKKLSVYKLLSRAPGLEKMYAKKGIRNIPLGGDLFTQGGVLIFDRQGKLRFVYYETFGKPLDMEAIQWAIDEANQADDDQSTGMIEDAAPAGTCNIEC